jgi:hypothetical protein
MTVGELKERMTTAELANWRRYTEEMGPLNLAWRIDYAVARSALRFLGGHMRDLMPWPRQEEEPATPEAVLALLRGAKKKDDGFAGKKDAA